jgi:unsaturated rhamnogalacturonyl hydrolase
MARILLVALCFSLIVAEGNVFAQPDSSRTFAESLPNVRAAHLRHSAIGVTRHGTAIGSLLCDEDLDFATPKVRVLLIGGMDGAQRSVQATLDALRWFQTDEAARRLREKFAVSAVPCVNPDGLAAGSGSANASGGNPSRGYPPPGTAYNSATDPEAAYLWRWIGMHAPDLVVDVRAADQVRWYVPPSSDAALKKLADAIHASPTADATDQLVDQLVKVAPCETGTVPAVQVAPSGGEAGGFLPALLTVLEQTEFAAPSPARREMQRRLDRSPLEVAKQLSQHYGHELNQVEYIPALALVGRVRLGQLIDDETHQRDVERIVSPYFAGDKPTTPKSGSGLSGHLIFCELADQTSGERRARYIELARKAADLGFDAQGRLQPSMPFHNEMSDAVFMGGPILARVGRLTGDSRYFDASVQNLRFMNKLVLRDDGLYRHSPLDEAAWGRGNGFPALGLAMCLSDFPADHPGRKEVLEAYQRHMAVLSKHQDPTGCWHQVVDRPESYRELSCTCMIAYAMIRGVRSGWLDREQYAPTIDRAWYAIRTRVAANGRLVDVCTGTGKQNSLRDYDDRPAILGPDPRGGAMALMVATEMASLNYELLKRPDR